MNWKTSADATQAIWQDPSSYDPYTQGPPYLPESSKRMARKFSSSPSLSSVLVALRALAMVHQTHHWLTSGSSFYADHLLFERLYSDTNGEVDSLGERAVGVGSLVYSLSPVAQAQQVLSILEGWNLQDDPQSYVASSLKAERWVLDHLRQVAAAMKDTGTLSRGTDNLLAGIEDKHEEHVYLLTQRGKVGQVKGATSDRWKVSTG